LDPDCGELCFKRAADASRQLGDSKNLGRLLEEIRCQLHSGYKFNHRDRSERRVYFVRSPLQGICVRGQRLTVGYARKALIGDRRHTEAIILDCLTPLGHGRAVMKIRVILRVIVCAVLLAAIAPAEVRAANRSQRTVKIGVLADLSGSWSTLGKNTVAALRIAAADLRNIRPQFRPVRFRFLVRDTHLDPEKALDAIQDLNQRGVKIIIGPQSSSEVAKIKPFADAHNILVISQGSTASSLAIPGDNIFRFCPNDMREAEALVALLLHDGIHAIVPLWRNDAGNNGLHDSVQIRFQAFGGTVASGFRYEPTTTDFSAATNSVASQIASLIGGGTNPSAIAVYLAAFEEVVDVFHSAQANPTLANTTWYGTSSLALSAALTGDAAVAGFAASVGFPNPTFGLPDALQKRWQPIADAIEARTGITADAFALSTYDALFVVNLALVHAKPQNFDRFKAAFIDEASHYRGITGSTELDAAGDRLNGDFDFWAVRLRNGNFTWVRVGTYNNGVLTVF
jgi:branched-chain amino acid transport system substrate-binding protein